MVQSKRLIINSHNLSLNMDGDEELEEGVGADELEEAFDADEVDGVDPADAIPE